eukprot:scaffold7184_cov64-Phaeocystis_antarctica.AAC.1
MAAVSVDGRAIYGYRNAFEAAEPASLNAFNKQSAMRLGISVLLSSFAPVVGEVSLVRSHSEMAVRS